MKDEIVSAFAQSIYAKAELLRSFELSVRERRRVREAIAGDIRKFTDVVDYDASDSAWTAAEKIGVDLHTVGWHDQPRFDPGREVFHLEHVTPVKTITGACLDAQSPSEVADALRNVKVAWILKSEDAVLTSLGFRSNRPDPMAAYKAAGISLRKSDAIAR